MPIAPRALAAGIALLLLGHRKSDAETRDGTWTLRVRVKNGVWRTMLQKSWVENERFRRARFVLVGGSTVLVSANDLRRACDTTSQHSKCRRSKFFYMLRFDLANNTLNGQPVQFQIET